MKSCEHCHNHQAWYVILALVFIVALLGFSQQSQAAKRIVTIDGAVTEIVFALDQGERVVGRDVTSSYPPSVNDLPDVGYMRQLTVEGILSLSPDMVIATSDSKPSKTLDAVSEAGVKVVIVDNEPSFEGVLAKVTQIAKALDVVEKGENLKAQVRSEYNQAMEQIEALSSESPTKGLFVLAIRNGNLNVAGAGSRANAFIKMLGLTNPVEQQVQNYQLLSSEAAIEANPDVVLMIEQGLSMSGGRQAVMENPVLKQIEAMKLNRLVIMPNDSLAFGPRIGQMIQQVSQQISN